MLADSLLWQVSNDSNVLSYIFGTMHVRDKVAFRHLTKAENALYRCDQFRAEIHLREAQSIIKSSDYEMGNGQQLSAIIGEKKFAKSQRVLLKSFGIDIEPMQNLYPLILVNKMTESILSEDKSVPLDLWLWQKAETLNMEMKGLEEVHEQINTLKELDMETQLKQFKELVRNVKSYKKTVRQLVTAYESEKIQSLFKLTSKGLGHLRAKLLYDRNEIMVNRIFENIEVKTFYAIGASHLAGNKGVLPLLKRKGLKLKPVYK